MDDTKRKIKKQCAHGIWSFPEDREADVMAKIDAIVDEAGLEAWRQWMFAEFPENRPAF